MKQYLTVNKIAEKLDCHRCTVFNYFKRGILPLERVKKDRRVYYLFDDNKIPELLLTDNLSRKVDINVLLRLRQCEKSLLETLHVIKVLMNEQKVKMNFERLHSKRELIEKLQKMTE